MTGAVYHLEAGAGDQLLDPGPQRPELEVVSPRDQECGHVDGRQLPPHRFHRPGAQPHECVGDALGAAFEPVALSSSAERAEHRLRQPLVEEGAEPNLLEPGCECGVAVKALRPLTRIIDARRGSDEHQPPNQVMSVEGRPHAEASSHRVADVDRAAHSLRDLRGGLGEGGHTPRGQTVPGKVNRNAAVGILKRVDQLVPRSARLRESMHKPDYGSGAGPGCVKHLVKDDTS